MRFSASIAVRNYNQRPVSLVSMSFAKLTGGFEMNKNSITRMVSMSIFGAWIFSCGSKQPEVKTSQEEPVENSAMEHLEEESRPDSYERESGEDAEAFAKRILSKYELRHAVIESAWGDKSFGKKIFAVYRDFETSYPYLEGIILQPVGDDTYKRIDLPEQIEGVGSGIEILAVFFDDVDNDGDQEMLFITEYLVRITDEETGLSGMMTQYSTFIYKQKKDQSGYKNEVELLPLSQKLEGKQTVAEVREALKSLR